ncbi:cellulose synthase-like protein G2 isoform X1 [Magnolia sinica]|uniref:cellulose synthase-like protein G2 isoform X1 n=1 Tax=Magnolia sinica TaxID=86752 RepID=UPI00265A0D57|nr:cellulose synthase-like protein G2 isoform X1 [Magnolia sinica]
MVDKEQAKMPMLVYVSHEKKRSYPHHFKAGALNVLEERGRPLQWTNQVVDKKQAERYEKEIFDFQGATLMLVPLITLAILNMVCLIGWVFKVIVRGSYDEMFGQIFLTSFILVNSYPLY